MSMTKPTPAARPSRSRSFWAVPVVSVALGIAMGAGAWSGGQHGFAVFAFALMLVLAVGLVVAARHSETVNGLLDRPDERVSGIDRDATVVAGVAVIWAVIGGFVFELATGGDTLPYVWVATVAGVAYLASLIVLHLRR
jgi:hypothetical protein